MTESKLKVLIREYLADTDLKETLHDPKLDLGLRFLFPKGKAPNGKPQGKPFIVLKNKRNGFLEVSSTITSL